MHFNPVALDSLLPTRVLHGRMTGGYPFQLAVSPQTLPRPTFPIHSLWETLGSTDQVAYDNLYDNHWSHSKRHPSRIQTLLGWNRLALLRVLYARRFALAAPPTTAATLLVIHQTIQNVIFCNLATLDTSTSTNPLQFFWLS